jgi:hypothetical protein
MSEGPSLMSPCLSPALLLYRLRKLFEATALDRGGEQEASTERSTASARPGTGIERGARCCAAR